MNVLINLLPDTRLAKQREARRRHLFTGLTVLVVVVCGGIVAAGALFVGGQKVLIANANKSIADSTGKLQQTDGLIAALTAQEHLEALPGLYSQRIYLSKFFHAYSVAAPQKVTLRALSLTSGNALTITGSAQSYLMVAQLTRAMEAENITIGDKPSKTNQPYFTDVVISSVGQGDEAVDFKITAKVATGVTSGK